MSSLVKQVDGIVAVFISFIVLGLLGLIMLLLFGNLQGNLGFAASSQGENDSNLIINNITGATVTFFGFTTTWFTLLAVTLLIVIALGVVGVVIAMKSKGKGSAFQ